MLPFPFCEEVRKVFPLCDFSSDLGWREHYMNIIDVCTAGETRQQSNAAGKRIWFVRGRSCPGVI